MMELYYSIAGYIFGAIAVWIICKPGKSFEEGWEAARKIYSNWGRGFQDWFEAGWEAAKAERKEE